MSCATEPGDITITRGNNFPPVKWQFLISENPEVLFPLDGSRFHLMAEWPGGSLAKDTSLDPDLVIDLPTSTVIWTPLIADTRLLPAGNIAAYELERWIGSDQQTLVRAKIIVSEGLNRD